MEFSCAVLLERPCTNLGHIYIVERLPRENVDQLSIDIIRRLIAKVAS